MPKIDGRSEIQEIQVSGDWAYHVDADSASKSRLPGGGRPTKRAGHTLSVLRKADGRWQLARDANLLTPVELIRRVMQYQRQLPLRQSGIRGRRRNHRRPTPATAPSARSAARCCGSRRATSSSCCAARSDLTTYTFNKHVIQHRFCKHCGMLSFGAGQRSAGQCHGRDQHPLPGRFRVRQGAGAALSTARRSEARLERLFYICAGVAGIVGVALGAFAAHALKAQADARHARGVRNRRALPDVSRVRAVRGGLGSRRAGRRGRSRSPGWLFVAGIVVFSAAASICWRSPASAG